jgi:hypothetical protein
MEWARTNRPRLLKIVLMSAALSNALVMRLATPTGVDLMENNREATEPFIQE